MKHGLLYTGWCLPNSGGAALVDPAPPVATPTPTPQQPTAPTMLGELRAASGILNTALDQYLSVCTSIRQHFCKGASDISWEAVSLIANERLLIDSYKAKVKRADAAISLARNAMPTIVPINALPEEILSRIFRFVTYGEPCKFHNTYEYSAYPTLFTRVCARWRQVAINSPTLWTHIDVSSHGFRGSGEPHERHLAHAKSYLVRAGNARLDVHVAEDFPHGLYMGDPSLADFVISLASRMRSLEIHIELHDGHHIDSYVPGDSLCDYILSGCLVGCTPGVLKYLMIAPKEGEKGSFIQTPEAPNDASNWAPRSILELDMREQELESLLLPIVRLKVTGRFPRWSSRAYHGLTELRLYRHGSIIRIPDFQFTAMLTASPQLEILEFGLDINMSASRPLPAHLNNLRILLIDTNDPNACLPLIIPGPRPIAVSFTRPRGSTHMSDSVALKEYSAFRSFASSYNITEFYLRDFQCLAAIYRLVDLMSFVQVLALASTYTPGRLGDHPEEPGTETHVSLDTLCLLGGMEVEYNDLVSMLERYRVKKLVLGWDYSIYEDSESILVTRNDVRREMMSLGVDVEFYSPSGRHPMDYLGPDFVSYEPS